MAWLKRIVIKKKPSKEDVNQKNEQPLLSGNDAFPKRQHPLLAQTVPSVQSSSSPKNPIVPTTAPSIDLSTFPVKIKNDFFNIQPKSNQSDEALNAANNPSFVKSNRKSVHEGVKPVKMKLKQGGHRMENPLENGVPFWLTVPKDEEATDNETLIDTEFIEKVIEGKIVLEPILLEPRRFFDPFASIQRLKQADKYFNEHNVLSSSVRTVVDITSEADNVVPSSSQSFTIEWSKTINIVDLSPDCQTAVGHYEKPFFDVKRKK